MVGVANWDEGMLTLVFWPGAGEADAGVELAVTGADAEVAIPLFILVPILVNSCCSETPLRWVSLSSPRDLFLTGEAGPEVLVTGVGLAGVELDEAVGGGTPSAGLDGSSVCMKQQRLP